MFTTKELIKILTLLEPENILVKSIPDYRNNLKLLTSYKDAVIEAIQLLLASVLENDYSNSR